MTTAEEVKSADEVSAILEQAYYELATETRLARVGLKERQETAPIVERYRYLYTQPQIEAVRAEMEAATGERREELARLHSALLDGYIDTRVAALDDEVVTSLATATATVDGQTYPFHALVPTITRTDDPGLRERLLEGMIEVLAPRNALMARLQGETEAAIAELGYSSYPGFFAAFKRVDYPRFTEVIEHLL